MSILVFNPSLGIYVLLTFTTTIDIIFLYSNMYNICSFIPKENINVGVLCKGIKSLSNQGPYLDFCESIYNKLEHHLIHSTLA